MRRGGEKERETGGCQSYSFRESQREREATREATREAERDRETESQRLGLQLKPYN